MARKLIIIGASANSKLAHFYFSRDTEYEVVAFAVNREYRNAETFCGLPLLALEDIASSHPPASHDAFVAVGYNQMNRVREKLYHFVKEKGYVLPNYISPRCSFLTEESIGDNNFILEDNTIQPFVKIGSNNVLWSGNHIGHDGSIGDHNFITSHVVVSGFTRISHHCFLGVNATLRDDIDIAPYTLLGAGVVMMKSTKENEVYLAPKPHLYEKSSLDISIS